MNYNYLNQKESVLILNDYLFDMIRTKTNFYEQNGSDQTVVVFEHTGSFIGIYKDYKTAAIDHNVRPEIVIKQLKRERNNRLGIIFHYAKDILDGKVNTVVFNVDSLEQQLRDLTELANLYLTYIDSK